MISIDLFQAIRINDIEAFYAGIDTIDINEVNEQGQNLLHEAIAFNNILIAEELIKRDIDVNHQDLKLQTPLHFVANYKEGAIANVILENGGSLSLEDDYGNQPLWTAVFNAKGSYEIVEIFKKYNPDINHKNKHGKSPLDFACQIKDEVLVDILKKDMKKAYSKK